jgi:hypothetical protein
MHTTPRDGSTDIATLLTSFDEVYTALGGPKHICRLTGNSRASVWNWRQKQQFPARHYRVMRDALLELGLVADLRLWGFTDTAKKEPITANVAA